MSYEAVQLQLVRDNVLRINHPSLPLTPATFLTAANAASDVALTVRDNAGFADTDFILIGDYGNKQTELKKVNAAVTAGTSLTTTALTFAHPLNTSVRKVLFDKIEIYGNSSASSSGATLITTVDINFSGDYTEYVVTGSTYAYYGVRAIRSVATTYNGDYSDFIAASGYDTNTVGFIIAKAFEATNTEIASTGKFSRQWAYDQIFLGEQDVAKELKKWSWLQVFEYDAGNITLGVNTFTLPTNIDDKNTPKSIQGLRIGNNPALKYITKADHEYLFQNVAHTTVGTSFLAGATTVILTDSRDFGDASSFTHYTSTTTQSITFTTNTRSTNTLTGVTATTLAGTAGDQVWQNEPQGLPTRYTIYQGAVYFDAVPNSAGAPNLIGSNIWLDYYRTVIRVNTDGDSITVPDPLCIQFWLESAIKRAKNNGNIAADDTSWIGYQRAKKRLVLNETSGQSVNFVPQYMEDYGQTY